MNFTQISQSKVIALAADSHCIFELDQEELRVYDLLNFGLLNRIPTEEGRSLVLGDGHLIVNHGLGSICYAVGKRSGDLEIMSESERAFDKWSLIVNGFIIEPSYGLKSFALPNLEEVDATAATTEFSNLLISD